jgi:ABC-type bacteriocin/lantibiotic exporter with double-glycine peptidase domain
LLQPERTDIGVLTVFSLVVGVLSLATPITVEALVNTVAFGQYMQPLVVLAAILFIFLSFAAILKGVQAYVAEIIQRRIFVRVVADLAHRLPRVRGEAFDGKNGPELLNRFFDVIVVQKSAALLVLDGIAVIITALIGMIVLAFYHPFLLGFNFVLLASVAFAVFVLGRGAVVTAISESYKKYAVASWLEQLAHYPATFKLEGGLEHAVRRADVLTCDYIEARRLHFRVLMRQIIFTLGLQTVAATALLGLGGYLVIRGQLTLGQLVASELIVAVIVGAFTKLGKHMESFYDMLAAVDKLGHLFDLPTERDDGLSPPRRSEGARLDFHDVCFGYKDSPLLMNGLTMTVEPGQRVAVCGPAGSGKSALLELLFALREPTSGYIEYDNLDLRAAHPNMLRRQVAKVRHIEIFEGTIASNINMGRTDVTHADIREALQRVGLWQDVMALPRGLETHVTAGGSPLSDSQVIRLMLARALAGSPRLLIDSLLDRLPDDQLATVRDALLSIESHTTIVMVTGREFLVNSFETHLTLGPHLTSPEGTNSQPSPQTHPAPLQLLSFAR